MSKLLKFEIKSPTVKDEKKDLVPDFYTILTKRVIKSTLPNDFNHKEEADHLTELWRKSEHLRQYDFKVGFKDKGGAFLNAGGSGMVFRVKKEDGNSIVALKIARKKLFHLAPNTPGAAESLSPVSPQELSALKSIQHPNVVKLEDSIEFESKTIAIATTYVENPLPMDELLRDILSKNSGSISALSLRRLDNACSFLIQRCYEVASALVHMHSMGAYHFDIKPANILISKIDKEGVIEWKSMLTDLGACVQSSEVYGKSEVRVQFTWTYAHPKLTNLLSKPGDISGGGLKATANVKTISKLNVFDLFAFGRTIQELLAILFEEFGEKCFISYGFRYLHIVSCLLLDGQNAMTQYKISEQHDKKFIADIAMDYPQDFFNKFKITSAEELFNKLNRFNNPSFIIKYVPELDISLPSKINTGTSGSVAFTSRVSDVLGHPSMRRLKSELQLGWMKEIYPGATHTRWAHTIGVYSMVVAFYNSLINDPEIPTLRIIIEPDDILHAILASIIHDVGQTAFGHDFEATGYYDHVSIIHKLLNEEYWGSQTLYKTIKKSWPNSINIRRILRILYLQKEKFSDVQLETIFPHENPITDRQMAIDRLACDIIDGPIDADKLDYLVRDSISCGVTYGKGIDKERFLNALTVDVKEITKYNCRLALAYKAKGSAAIESLLLCRYQMYGAVYWHHTFRCIQSMFTYAVNSTLEINPGEKVVILGKAIEVEKIAELIYHILICGRDMTESQGILDRAFNEKNSSLQNSFLRQAPSLLKDEKALEFIWRISGDGIRRLVEMLGKRDLYKRIYEIKVGELGIEGGYTLLKSKLKQKEKITISKRIADKFLRSVYKKMIEKGPSQSLSEDEAKKRYDDIQKSNLPLIIIDFPLIGIPNEKNFPTQIGDPSRKYITGKVMDGGNKNIIFVQVKHLQEQIAALRVFVEPKGV